MINAAKVGAIVNDSNIGRVYQYVDKESNYKIEGPCLNMISK
jgi:hypothetical protein